MTELVVTAAYLAQLSTRYPALQKDFVAFNSHVKYCLTHGPKGAKLLASYVGELLRFSKAVVKGVNKGHFIFSSAILANKATHSYPRFLSGLMSMVFNQDGYLRFLYDKVALKLLLEILALLKRVKHPLVMRDADAKGFAEFESYQLQSRAFDESVIGPLAALWEYITEGIEEHATLGYPGSGATLDEIHPYIPRLSFVNPYTLPPICAKFYARAFLNTTGQDIYTYCLPGEHTPWLAMNPDYLASNFLPTHYPFINRPVLNTVCVPKNVVVSRAITVTNVGNTAMGATYRNSIKRMWSHWGIEHLLNVTNQELSHQNLLRFFDSLSLLDLEGGSSTLTLAFLKAVVPSFLKPFIETMEGAIAKTPNGNVNVTTLLMGDSIATAILTTTMFLVDLLSIFNFDLKSTPYMLHDRIIAASTSPFESRFSEIFFGIGRMEMIMSEARVPTKEDFHALLSKARTLPINNVGDDKVFPSWLETDVRENLSRIGTTINEDKSSSRDSRHKETCGCWVISDGQEAIRIYPFRAPSGDTRPAQLQAATEFLQRTSQSDTITDLTLALAATYGHELTASSFRSDYVGSPVGNGLPCKLSSRTDVVLARVCDDVAYTFCIKSDDWSDLSGAALLGETTEPSDFEHVVPCRLSKRRLRTRTRFRSFRDPSKPKGYKGSAYLKSDFNSCSDSHNLDTASLREFRQWTSNFLGRFGLEFVEALLYQ